MLTQAALYGLAVSVMLALTRGRDASLLGCVLALGWIVSTVAWMCAAMPAAVISDLVIAYTAYRFWTEKRLPGWLLWFTFLSIYQLMADAVADAAGGGFYEQWATASNAIFVLQLFALSWEGGLHVGNSVLDRLGFGGRSNRVAQTARTAR